MSGHLIVRKIYLVRTMGLVVEKRSIGSDLPNSDPRPQATQF